MVPRLYYTLFMLLALAVFVLTRRALPKSAAAKLAGWQQLALALAAFVGGTLGAKLPFALTSEVGWWNAAAWLTDGKTITTGLVGAYLAVELAKLALDIRAKTGDTFALPLAAALAVGRWGCFFNSCCYGTPTNLPWGVDFGDGVPRHPTQAYESLFHLSMALALWWTNTWEGLRFQRLKIYLIAYCGYRFLTEQIRPEPAFLGGLTFYQWVCVWFALALAVQAVVDEWGKRRHSALA